MKKSTFSLPHAFSWILGLLAAGTLTLQIITADGKTTTLETALFSVLQFVFSLGFAWILTRIAAKNEFIESQKAFAIAAYRRINEIDEGVGRLISRATAQSRIASPDVQRELELVMAIALGVRASIKSSIADWGDVIGEEITTINRIEEIKDEQIALLETPQQPTTDSTATDAAALRKQLETNNEQLGRLLKSLPPSLRLVAEDTKPTRDPVLLHRERLEEETRRTGTIRLKGFWEPGLERDIRSYAVGDHLTIRLGNIGDRSRVLCAHALTGESVGIIVNNGAGRYYVFSEALLSFFESDEITVEISTIEPDDHADRHYFQVIVTQDSMEERARRIKDIRARLLEKQRARAG
jgi:hypothetical protein